jgi:uncharacterized membrane protein
MTRLDPLEVWNYIDIAVLTLVIPYGVLYYARHSNGKKNIRLFASVVLSVVLTFRLLLAFHLIGNTEFSQLNRPWSILVYALPALECYVDWKTNRKPPHA